VTIAWQPVLYTDEDTDELVALCQLQPGKAAAVTAEYIHWQHTANPAGLAQVGLAKEIESGKIIGLKWLMPMRIQVGDEVRLGAHSLYTLVHPDHRRQGVFTNLVAFCNENGRRQGYQFWYGFPNPNSYPIFVHRLGWADIGRARLFIRPLNISRLITRRLGQKLFQRALAAAGRVGASFFSRPRPLAPGSAQITVEEVNTDDPALDDFWRRVRGKHLVMIVRDTAFLHWRYTQIPERKYLVLAAWQDGLIIAFIVLRCVIIEGIACGMVVDFLVEPTGRGRLAGEMLLHSTAAHFQHNDVDMAGCLMLPHAEEVALLRRQGYILCPTWLQPQPSPVILLVNDETPGREVLHNIRSWFLTMGDFDAV
jgi:GNAT superfamily N-acetyltransferase